MTGWAEYGRRLFDLMTRLEVTDRRRRPLAADAAFGRLRKRTEAVRRRRNTIYCVGNGASASIASHFAADMAKNGRLHTEVFSDLALITAISNDMGYVEVFSEPLSRRAVAGDVLVAISSSGRSPNILRAAECARAFGLTIVTLSAMAPDNPLRRLGDLNFYFPADDYGAAESLHSGLLHYWIDMFLEEPA